MSFILDQLSVAINQKPLLQGINLHIKPDKLTLLIGPNGAGKSTLLKACAGDIKPSEGAVVFNQKQLHNYNSGELSRLRAVMTQSYAMSFGFSVEEVVSMGCFVYEEQLSRQGRKNIVEEVMAFMGITSLKDDNFMQLSGGEQQRTQLARVLVQLWFPRRQTTPRYLLLDEPTSSLDIYHQYQVLTLAKALKDRGIGVLAVVHDLSLAAAFADHIVLMANGRIVVEGQPEEVLQSQYLSSVYGMSGHYFQPLSAKMPTVLVDRISS